MARIKVYNSTSHQWEYADVAVEPDFTPDEAVSIYSQLNDFIQIGDNILGADSDNALAL